MEKQEPTVQPTGPRPTGAARGRAARTGEPSTGRFRHVLVCLDRSEAAEAALPLASHLARMDRARLTLLHVLDILPDKSGTQATDAIEWEVVRQEALSYLEEIAERTGELGIQAVSRVAEGPASQCVAALATELEADLVVISTTGESGGVNGCPLGGTAQKILARAKGPVLVAPSRVGTRAPRVPFRRILVPLDGSMRGECVLPTAVHLARQNNAEIVVAHVVSDPIRTKVLFNEEDLAVARELSDRLVSRASAYLEQIRSQLAASGVRARVSIRRAADHREGLLALAAAEDVDLIVPSAHGSVCNPHARFGSMTSYVMTHSTTPVLVIQDLPGEARRAPLAPEFRLPPRASSASTGGD